MRDLKLITSEKGEYSLDINIVSGYGELLPYENQTQDQRAAVSAYMIKGTVPGYPELGVDWSSLYDKEGSATLINIDNEIKQAMQKNAVADDGIATMYAPAYEQTKEGMGIVIYKS